MLNGVAPRPTSPAAAYRWAGSVNANINFSNVANMASRGVLFYRAAAALVGGSGIIRYDALLFDASWAPPRPCQMTPPCAPPISPF